MSCRGYMSQSEMHNAAIRFQGYLSNGQTPLIIHLGDHDPSGMDMTRDINDRLALFNTPVDVRRIALNMHQIEQYSPPPNPAKVTDSRANEYIKKYGHYSWELDALDPDIMVALIAETILEYRSTEIYDEVIEQEAYEKSLIMGAVNAMRDV